MASDKVAILTAAGSGIGKACAQAVADAGYTVVLQSKSGRAIDVAEGLGGIGLKGSVTEIADLEVLIESAVDEFGRLDAVVNNTGHPPKGELLELNDDDWFDAMNLVLMNVIRMSRLATPIMIEQGGGSFVNISTFSAFEPSSRFPTSSVLRAGLGSYTKLFANEFAAEGIRMNSVLPGYTDSYEIDDETRSEIPMHRRATTEEIAHVVRFLLSNEASYLTGQNIPVDGGLTRSV